MALARTLKNMHAVLSSSGAPETSVEKKRVLLVEDHALMRAGIRSLLSKEPNLDIVGEASNGRDAINSIQTLKPDLILMDLSMHGGNGIEAIAAIKRRHPKIRILVVTMHQAEEYIHESLQAGADGYVLKDASHEELCAAVRSVLVGKTYLSPDISDQLLSAYRGLGRSLPGGRSWESLSLREREVLKLIGEGRTNQEAADYLFISVKTVEKHRSNLMKKLDLRNTAKLTAFAIEKGLVMT
jgi:DNA-binding NarL/FixJ family response regulator